jgi:biopolymer transport protein ExbD
MAFGSLDNHGSGAPMAEINVIPLVDIMLVLLVIFIVTAPMMANSVRIDLPRTSSQPLSQEPDTVALAIDADGRLFWDTEEVDRETLSARLIEAGQRLPTPELHLRADRGTRYETLAGIMAEAGKAGLSRIGFISDPSSTRAAAVP